MRWWTLVPPVTRRSVREMDKHKLTIRKEEELL